MVQGWRWAHIHTHSHTRARTHTHSHTHTHAHTLTHTHTHSHTHTHTHTTHSVLRGRDAELLLGINSTSIFDKFYENSFCQRHSLSFPQDHVRISGGWGHCDPCRNGRLSVPEPWCTRRVGHCRVDGRPGGRKASARGSIAKLSPVGTGAQSTVSSQESRLSSPQFPSIL